MRKLENGDPLEGSHSGCQRKAFAWNNESEPGHEKMYLTSYADNKGADQPAHPHSLTSAFVVAA